MQQVISKINFLPSDAIITVNSTMVSNIFKKTTETTSSSMFYNFNIVEFKLRKIRNLNDNWDGYGSQRITENTIKKSQFFAKYLRNLDFINPTPNSGIMFEYKNGKKELILEIYDSMFDFAKVDGDNVEEFYGLIFNETEIINLIKWLNDDI